MTQTARRLPLPKRLVRLQSRADAHVLVLFGTSDERTRVARSLHRANRLDGPFLRLDCNREEDFLQSAMRAWIAEDGRVSEPPTLLGNVRGTLFLDAVDGLSPESQKLLLAVLKRLADSAARGRRHPRLIVGSRSDLEQQVAMGTFLPQLYDTLNKVRFDLQVLADPSRLLPASR